MDCACLSPQWSFHAGAVLSLLRWNRLRKQPFVDWIVKLMARTLSEELFGRVLDLFLRGRTASGAHGRSHAASTR